MLLPRAVSCERCFYVCFYRYRFLSFGLVLFVVCCLFLSVVPVVCGCGSCCGCVVAGAAIKLKIKKAYGKIKSWKLVGTSRRNVRSLSPIPVPSAHSPFFSFFLFSPLSSSLIKPHFPLPLSPRAPPFLSHVTSLCCCLLLLNVVEVTVSDATCRFRGGGTVAPAAAAAVRGDRQP